VFDVAVKNHGPLEASPDGGTPLLWSCSNDHYASFLPLLVPEFNVSTILLLLS
jgi:hypothetical protein